MQPPNDDKPAEIVGKEAGGINRWSDNPFWGISSRVTAFCTVVLALAAIGALVVQGQHRFIDPHTEQVAARIDTLNHIPIFKEISEIRQMVKNNDTVFKSIKENFEVIKSILEETSSNDQLLRAKERRSNPTGIR